jgi:hypothetical protein
MGARFFDGLVFPVIAGLAGLMIGSVFFSRRDPRRHADFYAIVGGPMDKDAA